ncbi:MAG: MXAN_5187 C-terminal domain-containing protein, partial [Anaeromyxobacteraceae bacterium]
PRPPPLPPRPAPTPPPAMAEPEMRALFDAYVAAKRSCNEDVSKLSYEALARTVAKQSPEIAARFRAKRVEFKVAVKDGKAVLTAVPKI